MRPFFVSLFVIDSIPNVIANQTHPCALKSISLYCNVIPKNNSVLKFFKTEKHVRSSTVAILSPMIGATKSPRAAVFRGFWGHIGSKNLASELLLSTLHSV
jgi:hypothetical protein